MMIIQEKNRRSALRKRPRGQVQIECRGRGGFGPDIALTVWDLSQTGVCLVTHGPVVPGETLEIRIASFYYHRNITIRGTVVWVDPLDENKYTAGVRFERSIPYGELSQLTA